MADLKEMAKQANKGSLKEMKTTNSPKVSFDADGSSPKLLYKGYEVGPSPFDPGKLMATYNFLNEAGQLKYIRSGSNGLADQMSELAIDSTVVIKKTGEGMSTRYQVKVLG